MPARATKEQELEHEGAAQMSPPSESSGTSGQRFMRLDIKQVSPTLTVINGARVVYLGNNPKKTQAWGHTILQKPVQHADGAVRVLKEISKSGFSNYDFNKYGDDGEVVPGRLFQSPGDKDLDGRPYSVCEHPEHLRLFLRGKSVDGHPEYEVLIPEAYHRFMEEYVRRKERFRTTVESTYKDTGGVTARHSVLVAG
ncbi:MAG: hypothetical protein A3E78_16705 [Alphaproteobacteria bacterium RIFCSPHIGHO2_12_FULL_63_12]|nr:MAG: hypothetical protein A3E78_16705 [Alphaproteobacteria bacterium RIFCSPHIGHO2_12_FULL_63_12]